MVQELLIETREAQINKNHNGDYFLEGIYLSAKPNANKRWYSPDCLSIAVEDIQPKIKAGRMVGCLGHEESTGIDPAKISHLVQALKQTSDGSWYGRSKILHETESGCLLRKLIEGGVGCGISSRSLGATKFNPKTQLHEVQEGTLQIISMDSVIQPSTNEHLRLVMESIESQASVAGHSLAQYKQKHITHDDVRRMVASVGKPELLAQFDKYSINFDEGPGSVFNPHMSGTVPAHLDALRFDLIRRLIDVNKEIKAQNDQGIMRADGKAKDIVAQYSKLMQKTNDPIRKTSLKRECANDLLSLQRNEMAMRLLSRVGHDGVSDNHSRDLLESIRGSSTQAPIATDFAHHDHPGFADGIKAFKSGGRIGNPHMPGTKHHAAFDSGFLFAKALTKHKNSFNSNL
jgi:hypothetical protein